jgi:hypothetical protein
VPAVAARAQRPGERQELRRPVLEGHRQADQLGIPRGQPVRRRRDVVAGVEPQVLGGQPGGAHRRGERADREVVLDLRAHEHRRRSLGHLVAVPSLRPS